MKQITKKRHTFSIIWVWVIFLVILATGYALYELFVPCESGLVVVECAFSKAYINISLFEAAFIYLIIGTIYKGWKTRRHKNLPLWEYLVIGAITFLWVFGPLLFKNYIFSTLSFPILYLNLHLMFVPWGELLSKFMF